MTLDSVFRRFNRALFVSSRLPFFLCLILLFLLGVAWTVPPRPLHPNTSQGLAQAIHLGRGQGLLAFDGGFQSSPPPFYSALLALFSPFSSNLLVVGLWLNRLFGLLVVGLVYLLTKHFMGHWTAFIAAFVLLTNTYSLTYLFGTISVATVQTTFILLACFSLLLGFERRQRLHFILAGVAWAAAFLVDENTLLWLPLPLLTFLLVDRFRTRRNAQNLVLLYLTSFLLTFWWWISVWVFGDGYYMVGWFSRRLPAWSPTWFDLIFPFWLLLLYLLWRFDRLVVWFKNRRTPSWWWRDLGMFILLFYTAIMIPPFTWAQWWRNWLYAIEADSGKDVFIFLSLPAWLFVVIAARRWQRASTVIVTVFIILALPLLADVQTWSRDPDRLLSVFVFSAVLVAILVVAVNRFIWRMTAVWSPGRAWGIQFLLVVTLAFLGVRQIERTVVWAIQQPVESGANLFTSIVNDCATALLARAEPDDVVMAGGPLSGELYVRTAKQSLQFVALPLRHSSLRLTDDQRYFSSHEKLAIESADLYVTPLHRYRFIETHSFFQQLSENNVSFLAIETASDGSAIPLAAELYFDRHPAFESICKSSDGARRLSIYRVEQSELEPVWDTYLNGTTFARLYHFHHKATLDLLWSRRTGRYIEFWPPTHAAAKAYARLGTIFLARGDTKQAAHALQHALALRPSLVVQKLPADIPKRWQQESQDNPWAGLALGMLQLQKGNKAEAVSYLINVLELEPAEASIYMRVADAYFSLDMPEEAYAVYNILMRRWPDGSWAYDGPTLRLLADLYQGQGDRFKALKACERAIKAYEMEPGTEGDEPSSHLILGHLFLQQARLQ